MKPKNKVAAQYEDIKKTEGKERFDILKFQKKAKGIKDKVVEPIIRPLYKLGVKPLLLSIIGLIFGILGAISVLYSKKLAILFIALTLLFDNLDGALARYKREPASIGFWQDYFIDRTVRTAYTVVAIIILSGAWQILCILGYIAYIIVCIHNVLGDRKYVHADYAFNILLVFSPPLAVLFSIFAAWPRLLVIIQKKIFQMIKNS